MAVTVRTGVSAEKKMQGASVGTCYCSCCDRYSRHVIGTCVLCLLWETVGLCLNHASLGVWVLVTNCCGTPCAYPRLGLHGAPCLQKGQSDAVSLAKRIRQTQDAETAFMSSFRIPPCSTAATPNLEVTEKPSEPRLRQHLGMNRIALEKVTGILLGTREKGTGISCCFCPLSFFFFLSIFLFEMLSNRDWKAPFPTHRKWETHIEWKREVSLPSPGSLAKWPQRPYLNQDKARSQDSNWVSHMCGRDSSTIAILHCLPRHVRRMLDQKKGIQDLNRHDNRGFWFNLLYPFPFPW